MISVISGALRARLLSGRGRTSKSAVHARQYLICQLIYVDIRASLGRRDASRNKAFMEYTDRVAFYIRFLRCSRVLLCRCWTATLTVRQSEPRSEHGVPAAGRQCISAHYPKITIIL